MPYLTNDKVVVLGAGGAIGSNMLQILLTLQVSPNVCGYDPFEKGLQGACEEMYHCAFPGANLTWTSDIGEALTGAKYIISSGGAPRKQGMTREDLLKGNAEIAAQLGKDIKQYCPDVKFVFVIFNPADITGLICLIHSGIHPSKIGTLAGLDSTRLQTALAQHFKVPQDQVTGARTYGGHGEEMAVFASTAKINGKPLSSLIGTADLPAEKWAALKQHTSQGGKAIIDLRGRSSFQSPAHHAVMVIKAAVEGKGYNWPVGTFCHDSKYKNVMMAMETTLGPNGVTYQVPHGTAEETADLDKSYHHLEALRDEVVGFGILPPVAEWTTVNPNLSKL